MTKKIQIIIFFLVFALGNSQTHRFIYEYRFLPDSTKVDSIITENTRLEIFKDHSEFVSDLTAKRDSAFLNSSKNSSGEVGSDLKTGSFRNSTWKGKKKLYTKEHIGIEGFKVLNPLKQDWELSNETQKIQGYNCQKAITNYGGRIWEAWFTTEIPIQDGPYVFRNLPGLIVQINDSTKNHTFLLIANFKTTRSETYISDKKMMPTYEVNREKFNKKWKEYRKNPIGGSEQFMLMNPKISNMSMQDENGKEMDMNLVRIDEREQARKLLKTKNNYIDLQLYR
jgi:GLPGLI family protein